MPLADLVADAEAATRRHDERQMADEPRIDHAGMRRDPCAGLEQREHHRRTPAGDSREVRPIDRLPGPRAALEQRRVGLAILAQEQGAPVAILDQRLVGVEAHVALIGLDVRPESVGALLQQLDQLGADRRGRRLDRGCPVEAPRVVILDLRQLGVSEDRRALEILTTLAGG